MRPSASTPLPYAHSPSFSEPMADGLGADAFAPEGAEMGLPSEIGASAGAAAGGRSPLLSTLGGLWFLIAAAGQGLFIYFIIAYYGPRTASGNYPSWNDKQLIDGYIGGDPMGNFMFITHVLLAAIITFGGLVQLTPPLRAAFPSWHHWNGRLYLSLAAVMALGGLWLVLVRGTYLSEISMIAISIDAVLILIFGGFALNAAVARNIDSHRQWAMRLFMAVSGVWFLRLGIMAWVVIMQGPVGMNTTLSGPTDTVLVFGCYLVPLAVLELYFAAQRPDASASLRAFAAVTMLAACAITAIGSAAAAAFMWLPELG